MGNEQFCGNVSLRGRFSALAYWRISALEARLYEVAHFTCSWLSSVQNWSTGVLVNWSTGQLDHQITRSPNHLISRSPDHLITKSKVHPQSQIYPSTRQIDRKVIIDVIEILYPIDGSDILDIH